MTLARLRETGSGEMAARLVIEGLPAILVSDPNMERSAAMDGAIVKTDPADAGNIFPAAPIWEPDVGTVVKSGLRDPSGGTGASHISESSSSAVAAITSAVSYTTGNELWISLWVRRDSTALNFVSITVDCGASEHGLYLRLSDGAASGGIGTVNDLSVTLYTAPVGSGFADWYFIAYRCPGDASAVAAFLRVTPAAGLAASFPTTSATATGGVVVWGPRIADRTADADAADPTTGAGRERVYCFDLFGPSAINLVIDESVNIPEAILEVPGTSIRLIERDDEALAQALWHRPDVERWITANVDVSDTTVSLMSADGISVGDVVHIGTEAMLVTGIASDVLTVTRAYWNTIAQKHWSNEGGLPMRTLHNRPMRVRGRRVYLYLYGDADDLQGDGTQVWIGHVSGEPAVDDAGTVWRLQLASNAERLKGAIGGELDVPLVPRGIYYSWAAALRISIGENGSPVLGPAAAGITDFTGFYETQQEFCDALTTWLGTLKSGLNAAGHTIASTYTAIPTADGRWTVKVVVGAAVTDVTVLAESSQDGETSPDATYMQTLPEGDSPVDTLSSGDVIFPLWLPRIGDERLVPRGHFDQWSTGPLRPARDPSVRATYPERRVYLDRAASSDWSGLTVEWSDGAASHAITTVNTTSNYVEIAERPLALDPPDVRIGAYSLPNFRPTRLLATGTIENLRAGLVTNGAEYCNRAGMPFLTSADLASWADVIAEAARDRMWLTSRLYVMMQSVDLEDLLQHEMRLYGIFPIVDSDGKIGVRALERVTSGGAATDIDDELVTVGWSSMQRAQQTVNTVIMKTEYDPAEDEWMGREIIAQDMISYSQDHEERTLDIEPRSMAGGIGGPIRVPPEDAVDVMRRVTDIFGHPHDFVTVNLPWTYFSLRIGDPVTFSADHLPDYRTGLRPTTEVRGIVVARRWTLGEVHGVIRILVHGLNVMGYSPTARITSQSNPSGTDWLITVDASMYAPADASTDEFFEVGDKIRMIEVDSESPTIVTGEVTSVDTDTHIIGLTLDGAWTPGSDTWELCFDSWDNVVDDQQIYAAIAVDGLLETSNAHVFAP